MKKCTTHSDSESLRSVDVDVSRRTLTASCCDLTMAESLARVGQRAEEGFAEKSKVAARITEMVYRHQTFVF
jgi:hypothetical protein